MERREFMESSDGIHLMHGEFTLCGDAFDIGDTDPGEAPDLWDTDRQTVTCPNCIVVIDLCRGVRTRRKSAKRA